MSKVYMWGQVYDQTDNEEELAALRARVAELEGYNDEHQSLHGLMQMSIEKLEAERDRLRVIRCPDGIAHRWDGDGQCKECGNYAADLIDAALTGKDND